MKIVSSRNHGAFPVDEAAFVTPLLNPTSRCLIGYWVSNGAEDNFTYNDLYKNFLRTKERGVRVTASDQQGILDEKYDVERDEGGTGKFFWLPSAIKPQARWWEFWKPRGR